MLASKELSQNPFLSGDPTAPSSSSTTLPPIISSCPSSSSAPPELSHAASAPGELERVGAGLGTAGVLQNRRRGFFLVGHAVTMRERRDVLRRVSEGLFSGERTRGLDAGSLEEADPVAALIWMHQTLSNKRVFHGLLSAPEMDPRLLDLWVEFSYSRGMWSELFELYDGLKRPRDAAAMLIAEIGRASCRG